MSDPAEKLTRTPFLTTEQIYLTKIKPDDVHKNYITWLNDQETMQSLETGFFPTDMPEATEYVQEITNDDDILFLAIIDKTTSEHIGNIKLGPINWIHRRAEIGILIGQKEYWGHGIATECLQTVTEHAFDTLNLHKLVAGCYENNLGSAKAFRKVGFNEEGRREEHVHCNGEYMDVIELGLIRADSEV